MVYSVDREIAVVLQYTPRMVGVFGFGWNEPHGMVIIMMRKGVFSVSNVKRMGTMVFAVIICSFLFGCAERMIQRNEPVNLVCEGDLVTVNYSVRLDDGTLLYTTASETVNSPETQKSRWYIPSEHFGSEMIAAGAEAMIPGLGDQVKGLKKGKRIIVAIPPELAYGTYEREGVYHLDRLNVMPRILWLSREQYNTTFSVEPVVNEEVNLVPYFTSRIIQITDQEVVLESVVENDMHYDEEFGSVHVIPENDKIMIELTPNKDASFIINGNAGRITTINERSFTVDINHPLAGETLTVDLEILSLVKASDVPESIDWLEDHNDALSLAKKREKAVILVLYSDSCWWCEKLMDETLTDPRIKILNNAFIWVRVNTSEETELYDFYNQVGYPLIIILDKHGRVVNRIEGYMPAHWLRREIEKYAGQAQGDDSHQ